MFTKRQTEILRAVLSYAAANVDDINEAFAAGPTESDPENEAGKLDVNGDLVDAINDNEIEKIRNLLQ